MQVWQENLPTVKAFIAMDTQWRVGMSGATGLDYAALPVVLRLSELPRKSWPEVFQDIRLMERAALNEMNGIPEKDD